MNPETVLHKLIQPLIISGVYNNETAAFKDILISHIEAKIDTYDKEIELLIKKYGKDFDKFTHDIENNATPELEDDWMDWKGSLEMQKAWRTALNEVAEF